MNPDDNIQNAGGETTDVNRDLAADNYFAGRVDLSWLMLREQEKQRANDKHEEGRGKE